MKIRMQYVFTGCVQGVGFRYRAYCAARLRSLTGWVRNESDGSVTMEIQGEQHNIDVTLETIEKSHYISIENMKSNEIPVDLDENSFEICG